MGSIKETIIEAMADKKGEDITEIDFNGIDGTITDAFIICTANSNTQVDAIASEIDRLVIERHREKPLRTEGRENSLWIIVDYGNVMVHIFERETREFYSLEKLWSDARIIRHHI